MSLLLPFCDTLNLYWPVKPEHITASRKVTITVDQAVGLWGKKGSNYEIAGRNHSSLWRLHGSQLNWTPSGRHIPIRNIDHVNLRQGVNECATPLPLNLRRSGHKSQWRREMISPPPPLFRFAREKWARIKSPFVIFLIHSPALISRKFRSLKANKQASSGCRN